jgi:hypothetical protein
MQTAETACSISDTGYKGEAVPLEGARNFAWHPCQFFLPPFARALHVSRGLAVARRSGSLRVENRRTPLRVVHANWPLTGSEVIDYRIRRRRSERWSLAARCCSRGNSSSICSLTRPRHTLPGPGASRVTGSLLVSAAVHPVTSDKPGWHHRAMTWWRAPVQRAGVHAGGSRHA